eukprot:8021-Heterococcus_DN1.PRE.2
MLLPTSNERYGAHMANLSTTHTVLWSTQGEAPARVEPELREPDKCDGGWYWITWTELQQLATGASQTAVTAVPAVTASASASKASSSRSSRSSSSSSSSANTTGSSSDGVAALRVTLFAPLRSFLLEGHFNPFRFPHTINFL